MRLVVVVAAAFVVHVARKAVGDLKYIQNDHMKYIIGLILMIHHFDKDTIRNIEISISDLLNNTLKFLDPFVNLMKFLRISDSKSAFSQI